MAHSTYHHQSALWCVEGRRYHGYLVSLRRYRQYSRSGAFGNNDNYSASQMVVLDAHSCCSQLAELTINILLHRLKLLSIKFPSWRRTATECIKPRRDLLVLGVLGVREADNEEIGEQPLSTRNGPAQIHSLRVSHVDAHLPHHQKLQLLQIHCPHRLLNRRHDRLLHPRLLLPQHPPRR